MAKKHQRHRRRRRNSGSGDIEAAGGRNKREMAKKGAEIIKSGSGISRKRNGRRRGIGIKLAYI